MTSTLSAAGAGRAHNNMTAHAIQTRLAVCGSEISERLLRAGDIARQTANGRLRLPAFERRKDARPTDRWLEKRTGMRPARSWIRIEHPAFQFGEIGHWSPLAICCRRVRE